ncbi:MAG: hypothetical protein IJQ97_05030 [Paludibacteraceae bacterium]|nr:hypothetical protein [Paludibacteraceae bacterium]
MVRIQLPISKSIANRILLLQAIHGDPLMRVSVDMPDDVLVLHDALQLIRDAFGLPQHYTYRPDLQPLTIYLKNCGTALRFLQVHIDQCYHGAPVTLTGDPRLLERNGKPTTQTTSARILHGIPVPVTPDESPYIIMSRRMTQSYSTNAPMANEADWSAAAFWYEYVAIHGGNLLLEQLSPDSLQGDRIVADIYALHFGVQTTFTPQGAVLSRLQHYNAYLNPSATPHQSVIIDFHNCPDLYPAVALTCERLGMTLHATGTERLAYKESDRLQAVATHQTMHDHRIAMALLAADMPTDDYDCIGKSYTDFAKQIRLLCQ